MLKSFICNENDIDKSRWTEVSPAYISMVSEAIELHMPV